MAACQPLLEVRSLSAKVGIRRVLEHFNLKMFEGEIVCVQGPNGSGKSTLLNAIAGLEPVRVEEGAIIFCGREIQGLAAHERATMGLAYLRQRRNVFGDLTVEENLLLALGEGGIALWQKHAQAWATEIPLDKRASLLSGGQQQRLAWAMTILRPSRLVLADEPSAGLSQKLEMPATGSMLLTSHQLGEWSKPA